MKIACVVDKIGRVQYNRIKTLSSYMSCDIFLDSKKITNKYDVIYYSHFSLFNGKRCKSSRNYCSITSHKCLEDKNKTIKCLGNFDRVSVNNTFLFNEFKDFVSDLRYTPNGVDRQIFKFVLKNLSQPLKIGWVGNKDRKVKNFHNIILPLSKQIRDVDFSFITTSKKDSGNSLLNQEKMNNYYQLLDFLLVASDNEGTPNPALEALSCGVPVITTQIGNMVEIIKDWKNGVFVNATLDDFCSVINKLKNITNDDYLLMRKECDQEISKWDWSIKSKAWLEFLVG